MKVDRQKLHRVLYDHPAKAEGINTEPTPDALKQVNDIAEDQAALSYQKDLDRANVNSLESELPAVKGIMDQVDDSIDKQKLKIEDLPGDDKMHLASLKGLRTEFQTFVSDYNAEGKMGNHSQTTIRRKQNDLIQLNGIPTLNRIDALLGQLESTAAKDLAREQMGIIALETKTIQAAGPKRKANRALNRLALDIRAKIYDLPEPQATPAPQAPKPAAAPAKVSEATSPAPPPDPVEGKTPNPTAPRRSLRLAAQSGNGIDVKQILDYKEVAKHPKFQALLARSTQELKEEISRLLTSDKHATKDKSRLQRVIMIISILKQRGALNTKKLAKLMTHSNERFAQQL
jgi:hypothetical protein